MTTFNTKNQAKRKYYYIAGILVVLLIIVSLAFNSFRKSDNCDPISGDPNGLSQGVKGAPKPKPTDSEPINYVTLETNSGQIRGRKNKFNNNTVNTFYGIPYAKPPVGDLRFEKTVPIGQWTGVRDALQQPASCLQTDSPLVLSAFRFLNSTSSEDCLFMNIWSPTQEDQFLPVLVYIHGGAFAYGGVATEELDGLALSAQQDVVVVTIQYRLGIFGFLSFDSKDPKGNMGLYDQREALKWIHTNINKFGGDQDQITVIGHGAGAVSVGLHMMASDSKFYFQRTILQGFGLFWNKEIYSQSTKFSKKFAEEINCMDVPKIKECIKLVDVEKLLEVQQEILEDNPVAFGPRIPSDFAPLLPTEVNDSFEFQIDYMFGVNSEDDSLFLTQIRNAEESAKESSDTEEKDDEEKDEEEKEPEEKDESVETSDEEEEEKDDEPVERSTSKPILSITTSAAPTTTSTTTTTTTEAPMTTTSQTTTNSSIASTSTATESTEDSETSESEESPELEKEEKEDTDEGAEEPDESTEESEGDGEEDSTDEEKRRRRKKREVNEHMSRVVCPLLNFADMIAESNRSVYIYQLNEFSSYHDEIVFAFGYPLKHKNLYDNEEITFSRRTMKNWAQFANIGDIADEKWKSYSKESPMFLKMSISTLSSEQFNRNECSPVMNVQ